jgi:hypothetical protein
VSRPVVLGLVAVLACGGKPGTAPPPAPRPGAPAPAPPAASDARITYRLRTPLRYEISRYDSLFFLNAASATPQVTGRRALISVRPDGSRVQVVLDSVAGVLGPRLAPSALDSARGAEWEIRLEESGPTGNLKADRHSILVGQVGSGVRLLFPQLPEDGMRRGDTWERSSTYPLRLDTFESTESSEQTSRAVAGPAPGSIRVETDERLSRTGRASQGGRTLGLSGSGTRRVLSDFSPEGWVTMVQAQDSLELRVTVPDNPEPIPVRWRSTVIVRLRGTPRG